MCVGDMSADVIADEWCTNPTLGVYLSKKNTPDPGEFLFPHEPKLDAGIFSIVLVLL